MRRWQYCNAQGDVLCDTDLGALWGEVGPCIAIERGQLLEALLAGARGLPARLGIAVSRLSHQADRVTVDFDNGSRADYDLVIGADGVHSTVRSLTFGGPEARYAEQVAWRSVIPTRLGELDGLRLVLGDGRFVGLVPLGRGGDRAPTGFRNRAARQCGSGSYPPATATPPCVRAATKPCTPAMRRCARRRNGSTTPTTPASP
jgi:2-polyprenyl-6-methoxyphenol hydroxylase-like FAD-dependent oxidoreductase